MEEVIIFPLLQVCTQQLGRTLTPSIIWGTVREMINEQYSILIKKNVVEVSRKISLTDYCKCNTTIFLQLLTQCGI